MGKAADRCSAQDGGKGVPHLAPATCMQDALKRGATMRKRPGQARRPSTRDTDLGYLENTVRAAARNTSTAMFHKSAVPPGSQHCSALPFDRPPRARRRVPASADVRHDARPSSRSYSVKSQTHRVRTWTRSHVRIPPSLTLNPEFCVHLSLSLFEASLWPGGAVHVDAFFSPTHAAR